MCNVLIVSTNNEDIDQMVSQIRRCFANIILLPLARKKDDISNILSDCKVDLAIIDDDIQEDCFDVHLLLLKENPNLKSILVSSRTSFQLAQSAMRYGMIDYITKPIGIDIVYALDRGIQSIYQVSLLYNVNKTRYVSCSQRQQQILRYIHENFDKEITLDLLANHLFLSRHHTSRLVKEVLGMPFSIYLLMYRIEVAKKELSTSDASIMEIASLVGFNDQNYFSKKFKELTNMTPTNYRKRYMGLPTIIDSRI